MPLQPSWARNLVAGSDFAGSINEDDSGSSLAFLARNYPFCVGTSVATTLQCRTRAGTATLCGVSEFTAPSSPPKKYRTQTISGMMTICFFSGTPCLVAATDGQGYRWSGAYTYSATTCATTNGMVEAHFPGDGTPAICGVSAVSDGSTTPGQPFQPVYGPGYATIVETPTTQTWTYGGSCTALVGFPPNSTKTGTAVVTLSNPDTDADAIARFQAGTPYGAWAPCATPATCCLAGFQQRTAFTFGYADAQYRIAAAGVTPSRAVCAAIDIYRRPYGVGPYALFETLFVTGNSDGAGNIQFDGDVPNDVGFESYADNPRYFPPL